MSGAWRNGRWPAAQIVRPWLIGTKEHCELQAFPDAPGSTLEPGGDLRDEQFMRSHLEQIEPVAEHGRFDALHLLVRCDRIAFVTTAGQHHRRPKRIHLLKMS